MYLYGNLTRGVHVKEIRLNNFMLARSSQSPLHNYSTNKLWIHS